MSYPEQLERYKQFAENKMMPDTKEPKKLQIQGLRVIRTNDIPEGYFDVTGG